MEDRETKMMERMREEWATRLKLEIARLEDFIKRWDVSEDAA